ncbi:type IV secretion system protein VirD4 (plasmid) [Roseobacter denitrificans]|uniref:VirD4 protein, putative n=1 Tax=Roseobacter denitrificans (strain ATCC 33942 / OCh 114) TaxID=375451 RepID=Q07GJ0_ROSDO|nr:type IV secretion system ATPase VirD4 [Roseobacter denitrificans]ABI93409.1 virD4 protein, putative [Roseobacter denitrificans OCh 114]AVL51231.1 type IV secretion system protein VirD4 [Roseobacter denitrificans]SFG40385.1 type IV secretion system protein VirD4 [Roseobacter denitrificans OCh 114]
MNKTTADVLVFAGVGAIVGSVPALVAAGACALWLSGLSITTVELDTLLYFAPWITGSIEPFKTAALAGGAVWLVSVIAAVAIGYRPQLASHGSARWAEERDLKKAGLVAPLAEVQGPVFAKFGSPNKRRAYLTSTEIPHSLIAAPTGSGKGIGIVIPTLLTYNGSVVCLDVKGENFETTSRHRAAMGDAVFKFAPYDKDGRTHRYNPIDIVTHVADRRRFTEARRLASSLIIAKSKSAEGFLEGAREIFAASVVYAIEQETPTIAAVHDLISQHGQAHSNFETMAAKAQAPEAVSIFNRMASTDIRTLSAYLSVLSDGGLSLWADPAVRDATAQSDFTFTNLRRQPASIYFVVGPNDLDPLSSLIRLMFQQAVAITQREMPKADEPFPVLFLLDEFASLGRMDALSQAITTLRGYGGRLMIIVQSLSNLQIYGQDGAQNFLANCRLQLFMAPADKDTPDYISRAIGDFTRRARSKSWQTNDFMKSNVQEREEGARLIRPEELRKLGEDTIVALIQNQDPVRTDKVKYYEDKELCPIFEAQTGPLPEPPSLFEGDEADTRIRLFVAAHDPGLIDDTEARRKHLPAPDPSSTKEAPAKVILLPPPDAPASPPPSEPDYDASTRKDVGPTQPTPAPVATETTNSVPKPLSKRMRAIARAKAASKARSLDEDMDEDLEAAAVQDLKDHLTTHSPVQRAIEKARLRAEVNWPDAYGDNKPLRKRGA